MNTNFIKRYKLLQGSSGELPVTPHVLFFLVYNLLYLIPLLLAYLLHYEQGGVGGWLDVSGNTIFRICVVYGCGIIAFLAGASFYRFVLWSLKGVSPAPSRPIWHQATFIEKLLIFIICLVFLASKVSLIHLGVYRDYAFSTDSMTGGLWSFSTFCSETMVLAAVIVLFSREKHRVGLFLALSVLNGINLLHGTRIFFISAVMCFVLYGYINKKVTVKRFLLFGPISFAAVLLLAYAVFLSRSAVSTTGAFSFAQVMSPIVYESVFSQLSLIGVVSRSSNVDITGHPFHFFLDAGIFIAPRALVGDKDSLLYINRFGALSPLGAFNGYAQGLIYFGLMFPIFYVFMGMVGSYLQRKSQDSSWWFILYIFFVSDFLLHIMRDGYLIPLKMLVNSGQWIIVFILWARFIGSATTKNHENSAARLRT